MAGAFWIRTDADNSTGYGHLMRCLSLAEEIRGRGHEAVFFMNRADTAARGLVRDHGHHARDTGSGDDLVAEARGFPAAEEPRALIIDFSHRHVLAQAQRVPAYVDAVRGAVPVVALFDGFREDSIAGRVERLDVDLLVAPYVGADETRSVPEGVRNRLAGPRYFVFSPSFRKHAGKKHAIRRVASRILVTFGGSDPHRITMKALAAIDAVHDRRLVVRVVAGPGFDGGLTADIGAAAAASTHAMQVVTAPASLREHMAWCDLALTSSGFTKYELALTGTPSIQISINDALARVNEDFDRRGAAVHLGTDSTVTIACLEEALRGVICDAAERRAMSQRGQSLTDGLGAQRVVAEIMKASHAS